VSGPFGAPRFGRVRRSTRAKVALRQVVKHMKYEGWKLASSVGKDWYAISFRRPVTANSGALAPGSRPGLRA
jgi:hypothetical protein